MQKDAQDLQGKKSMKYNASFSICWFIEIVFRLIGYVDPLIGH